MSGGFVPHVAIAVSVILFCMLSHVRGLVRESVIVCILLFSCACPVVANLFRRFGGGAEVPVCDQIGTYWEGGRCHNLG